MGALLLVGLAGPLAVQAAPATVAPIKCAGNATNWCWSPANVTIQAGETVTFALGGGQHNVVVGTQSCAQLPCTLQFQTGGTFQFICALHPSTMIGGLTVIAAPPPPPTAPPPPPPTATPTPVATAAPTATPTAEPSESPSATPAATPTPTPAPTHTPEATPAPSAAPVVANTSTGPGSNPRPPTAAPSANPTSPLNAAIELVANRRNGGGGLIAGIGIFLVLVLGAVALVLRLRRGRTQ